MAHALHLKPDRGVEVAQNISTRKFCIACLTVVFEIKAVGPKKRMTGLAESGIVKAKNRVHGVLHPALIAEGEIRARHEVPVHKVQTNQLQWVLAPQIEKDGIACLRSRDLNHFIRGIEDGPLAAFVNRVATNTGKKVVPPVEGMFWKESLGTDVVYRIGFVMLAVATK